jgi:hypothetical protein
MSFFKKRYLPAIAAAWVSLLLPASAQLAWSDESASANSSPNWIDIYSTTPSDDGDNHYVHVQMNADNRYVFQYCKNGLPLEQVKSGETPPIRDCYLPLGSKQGYTLRELQSEFNQMQKQGKENMRWSLIGQTVSAVVIYGGMSAIEALTDGIATPAEAAAMPAASGAVKAGGTLLASMFTKKMVLKSSLQVFKLLISTGGGLVLSNEIQSKTTYNLNDSAFSSPSEERHLSAELTQSVIGGCHVVLVSDDIQPFERDLNQVLAKID